ncbi:MAG: chorismate synthase [Lachnospiraceae bacterium]|nr:chorismate synthase [Lachnospiraceae bacterium]
MDHFSYGTYYRFTIFGSSHEPLVGVTVEGIPAGIPLDRPALQAFLDRRAPGNGAFSSTRREADVPEFETGLTDGVFTGGPVRAILRNTDARPADYEALRTVPRPGHADWPAYVKTGQIPAGGGHYSGRMTAPLCVAGGIAKQLLAREGVEVTARTVSVGGIPAEDEEAVTGLLQDAKARGDSLGGVIECKVIGLPAGLGDHPFGGLENRLAQAVFAIPAVKGLEFGDGFALAAMRGSEANDGYRVRDGRVVMTSNHCGGVLGGMACGTPLVFRAAFKPTPSIAVPQESADLSGMENVTLSVPGRHDTCIVLRAVPVVEAAAAAALLDALWESRADDASDLPAFRRQIDAADRAILEAFVRRLQTADRIGACKRENGLPVQDPAREQELLDRLSRLAPAEMSDDVRALYETILRLSRDRQ